MVSTTGMISREIFETREAFNDGHERDFLTVGGMGHAASIAYGLSKYIKKSKMVFCIDGDGSVIMHMGALSTSGILGKNVTLSIFLSITAVMILWEGKKR